jgi:hypothetical protein
VRKKSLCAKIVKGAVRYSSTMFGSNRECCVVTAAIYNQQIIRHALRGRENLV